MDQLVSLVPVPARARRHRRVRARGSPRRSRAAMVAKEPQHANFFAPAGSCDRDPDRDARGAITMAITGS